MNLKEKKEQNPLSQSEIIKLFNDPDAVRSIVGGKAANLAELHQIGIPVPVAVGINVSVHRDFKRSGKISQQLISDLEALRKEMGGKVAIRSSATCEDSNELTMAGVFETFYLQDESASIEAAMLSIYNQTTSQEVSDYLSLHTIDPEKVEMGLVMQVLIEPQYSCVLYTGVERSNLLIQYTEGFGDALVDGMSEGSSLVIDSNGNVIRSKNTESKQLSTESIKQLAAAAQKIKTHFGDCEQDIEFAIDNKGMHFLQARTLTTELSGIELEMSADDIRTYTIDQIKKLIVREKKELGTDKVVLSDSNFSELLPRPKEMDFGVFAYIFTGSDGVPGAIQLGRKQMGYPLEDESVGFMQYIGGKPYFSIARDAHTFYAGFPDTKQEYTDTFVSEYLDAIASDKSKGEYPEMGLYVQDPKKEELIARFGEKGKQYYDRYLQFKAQMAEHATTFSMEYLSNGKPEADAFIAQIENKNLEAQTNQELLNELYEVLEHLRTVSCVNFVKSARLGFYYSQRLRELLAEEAGIKPEQIDDVFALLSQGLEGSEITEANVAIATQPDLESALRIGKKVVGHYSTGEMLEIRHSRLKDTEAALLGYVTSIFESKDSYTVEAVNQKVKRIAYEEGLIDSVEPEKRGEFKQVLAASQTYMALRETVKYQFVKEYSLIRDILVEFEKRLSLPEGTIFSLFPREVGALVADGQDFSALIAERIERFKVYPLLKLPSVLLESDIETLGQDTTEGAATFELFGKLLGQGLYLEKAVVVNIEDHVSVAAAQEVLRFYKEQALPIVLVAAQMNLSHDPLIMQADGLVIENAGIVSHGAQRARELGRGALGGIKASSLKTGELVTFDPALKTVTKIQL